MKKIIFGVVCCLGTAFSSFAQMEHRISYTFGFVSHAFHQELEDERAMKEYNFPRENDHGRFEYTDEDLNSAPLVFNFQYDCSLREHLGIGLCMGFERQRMYQKTAIYRSNGKQTTPFGNTYTLWEGEHRSGELKRRILYILPEVSVYWFKRRHVAMYTKGAIGARFDFEARKFYTGTVKSEKLPNTINTNLYFHVSPVAIEVGGPRWRGNIEFGYGAQGFFQYGVKHIIKGKEQEKEITIE